MTEMNKAFKFRLKPNKSQAQMFEKTFGCVRLVYNKMLGERKANYEALKEDKEALKKVKYPTPAKYKIEFEFLKEVDSLALANAQLHLESAYKNFFRGNAKFPKFKSKKNHVATYTTNNQKGSVRLENGYIKLPKIGFVKVILHRELPQDSTLKSVTISRTPRGKYEVSILVEYEKEIVQKSINSSIGLDFAMDGLFVDSMGKKTNYPYFYYQAEQKLKKAYRKLSRMKLRSNNWYRQKRVVAKIHEHVANARKDYLHKLSKNLANIYDMVGVEDLNMQGMSKALKFGKKVHDNAWGMFLTFLNYKLLEQGKQLIKIDKWFPSTKTCSHCGSIREMKLSDRVYRCKCGFELDRDHNSALNIKNEALRLALN
ncbi:MAG: transposase [Fusobacteria bacterium]|nr:transposase [Fusobacteriota bacterium]